MAAPTSPPPSSAADRRSPTSTPTPNRPPPSGTLLRVLTHTQNASAAVFGVFMGIHLAAPIAAGFAGTGAADGVMLVGREYYLFLEPLAVYLPLGLHISSSILRRALLAARTRKLTLTTHAVLGYLLLPLALPHLLLHRVIPATEGPPINALSPSELGYEFVGYACATRPWMTAGYVLLAGVGLWHGIVGSMKVVGWGKRVWGRAKARVEEVVEEGEKALEETSVNTSHAHEHATKEKTKRAKKKVDRRSPLRAIVTTITAAVCIGLVRLTADAQGMSSFVASRYDAVFASAPWAAIGFR